MSCRPSCFLASLLGLLLLVGIPLAATYAFVEGGVALYRAFGRLSEILQYEEARAAWRIIYESNVVRLAFFALLLIVYYRLLSYLLMPLLGLLLESPEALRSHIVRGIEEESEIVRARRAWYHGVYYRSLWAVTAYALGVIVASFYPVVRELWAGLEGGVLIAAGILYSIVALYLLPRIVARWIFHWKGWRLVGFYVVVVASYAGVLVGIYGVDPTIMVETLRAALAPGYQPEQQLYTRLDLELSRTIEARFRLLEEFSRVMIKLLLGG